MPVGIPGRAAHTQVAQTINRTVVARTEPKGDRHNLDILPQSVTTASGCASLARMNRDCSEAGNGLVLVRIENTVFLRTAIAIEHLREADACILVLCSSMCNSC